MPTSLRLLIPSSYWHSNSGVDCLSQVSRNHSSSEFASYPEVLARMLILHLCYIYTYVLPTHHSSITALRIPLDQTPSKSSPSYAPPVSVGTCSTVLESPLQYCPFPPLSCPAYICWAMLWLNLIYSWQREEIGVNPCGGTCLLVQQKHLHCISALECAGV